MKFSKLVGVALALVSVASAAQAQSTASNKAFYASAGDEVLVVKAGTNNSPVTLFNIPAALKTSSNGAVSAILSMECALWTYNTVTATNGSPKSSSSSRAAITVWVEIDGVKATPGDVVYCDRAQAVGLAVDLTCDAGTTSCTLSGTVTLDLFQATKNANSFTFFKGPLDPKIHEVTAKASGVIECWSSTTGTWMPTCPSGSVANWTNAQTQALIGKRSLLIEEHNNWGMQ